MRLPLMLACAALAVDQLTKTLIVRRFSSGRTAHPVPWVAVRLVSGSRVVGGSSNPRALVMWASVLVVLVLLVRYGGVFTHDLGRAGLGLAVGGAAGNLVDRLYRGAVVDFIDLGWWPVFNLADAAIVVGAALALWFMW